MRQTAHLRDAMADASAAFRRAALLYSLPILVVEFVGLGASSALVSLRAGQLIKILVLLLSLGASGIAGILVAAMYLRTISGGRPSLGQLREVLRYPKLWRYVATLFGQYLAWGFLAALLALVVVVLATTIVKPHPHLRSTAHGWSSTQIIWLYSSFFIAAVVALSRFQLALPAFAIFRGAYPELLNDCIRRSDTIRMMIIAITCAEVLPEAVLLAMRHRKPGFLIISLAARMPLRLIRVALFALWNTFFLLLRTVVAAKLFAPPLLAARSGFDA